VNHTDDLHCSEGAKILIGFWLNKGTVGVHKQPSSRFKLGTRPNSHWGAVIRERIATQVSFIKHWKIEQLDYKKIELEQATWFVDPPYQVKGYAYPQSSKNIDYQNLSDWCRRLQGQVIVCENEGANWLPFQPFKSFKETTVGGGH